VLAAPLGARVAGDIAEALADPALDAVMLTVPTPLHHALTLQSAAAGKHVFCEKPIALTLADAREMTDACARAGVQFMVGHVVRFFPEYARIGALLAQGAVGQVGVVRAARLNSYPYTGRGWYSNFDWSGGPVLDMMIHDWSCLTCAGLPQSWCWVSGMAKTLGGGSRRGRCLDYTTTGPMASAMRSCYVNGGASAVPPHRLVTPPA